MSEAQSSSAPQGSPGLELTCRHVGDDVVVIALIGELDLATVPQARTYLRDKTAARPDHVVLDLTGVTFMSSHGVSLLIEAHEGVDGIQGHLHLTGVAPNRPVKRAIYLTGMEQLLDIQDDQEQLIRRLAR